MKSTKATKVIIFYLYNF